MSGILNLEQVKALASKATSGAPRTFVWYLATPFTHKDENVREHRAVLAMSMAGELLQAGLNVFSPIAAHYGASCAMDTPEKITHADWMDICYGVMDRCDGLIISTMDGWMESRGVRMEIDRWSRTKGMRRALYVSPINMFDAWTPTFAWKPDQVGAK